MSENSNAIPGRRLPPGWARPEPPLDPPAEVDQAPAETEAGAELRDDTTAGTAAAADQAPRPNLFVLPGLPSYAGLDTPADDTDGTAAAAEHPQPDQDQDGAAGGTATADDGEYSGEWSHWLDGPADKARVVDPDGYAVDEDEDYDDEAALDEANVYVPDYNDPDAMAVFRDRTGGTRQMRPVSREKVTGRGSRRGGSMVWRIVGGTVAVAATAAVVGVVVVVNVNAAKDGPVMPGGEPAAAGITSAVPATSALPVSWDHATAGCTRTRTGTMTIGADPGDHSTPQMAILGFEWAYYVDRDAHAARSFTTPDAEVGSAEAMQAAIDNEVPVDTRYCVYITAGDGSGELWDVELHEQYPTDPEPVRHGQRITTTTTEGGKALITAIAHR